MADLSQDPEYQDAAFKNAPAWQQHQALMATDPTYAKMSALDQHRFHAAVRGEVMPNEATRGAGGLTTQNVYVGHEEPLNLKNYAIDRGAALASVPTAGMGPLAGAATRTGIQAVSGLAQGGVKQGLVQGAINAGSEALLHGGAAVLRNIPGIKGALLNRIQGRQAAGQAAENVEAKAADTALQDSYKGQTAAGESAVTAGNKDTAASFKSLEAQRKGEIASGNQQTRQLFARGEADRLDAAQRTATATNEQNVGQWVADKRSAKDTADVANRMAKWTQQGRQAEANTLAADRNTGMMERLRGTMQEQVPAQDLGSKRGVQNLAYGEQPLAGVRDALDKGQATIVNQIGKSPIRVPSIMAEGEGAISFPEAWKRASKLKGDAREAAFDEIHGELARLSPSASPMFGQLRETYRAAMGNQAIAKRAVDPTGGEYTPDKAVDFINKNRGQLFRRLGPDRYGDVAESVFRRPVGGGDPVSRPETIPTPQTLKPEMPPKPATLTPNYYPRVPPLPKDFTPQTPPVAQTYTPGPAPARITPQTIAPEAELTEPGLLAFLAQRVPYIRHLTLGKRWTGPQVPLTPSANPEAFKHPVLQMLLNRNQDTENTH